MSDKEIVIEIRQEDADLFELLKQDNVLKKIDTQQLAAENGAVMIFCSDCDQSVDFWNHFERLMHAANRSHRPFVISQAGGAIWLAKSTTICSRSRFNRACLVSREVYIIKSMDRDSMFI